MITSPPKVLISGGSGFLGSVIVSLFCKKGFNTGVIIRSTSDLFRLEKHKSKISFFDLSKISISDIVESFQPEIIIHTAVAYGKNQEVLEVFKTNLQFFINLFQAAISNGTHYFINSDTFSGKAKDYDYLKEYHLSKKHSLEWAKLMLTNTNSSMKFSNMRLEHLYGLYDSPKKFVPFIIESLLNKVENLDLTEGTQRRDFIFTEDVAKAYLKVIGNQKKQFVEYEVGTGQSTSIREFVELTKYLTNNSITHLNFGKIPIRKGEFIESKADNSKLKKLGWKPKVTLEEGIKIILKNKLT